MEEKQGHGRGNIKAEGIAVQRPWGSRRDASRFATSVREKSRTERIQARLEEVITR